MKASELIKEIEKRMEQYGDLPVYFYDEANFKQDAGEVWWVKSGEQDINPGYEFFLINTTQDADNTLQISTNGNGKIT